LRVGGRKQIEAVANREFSEADKPPPRAARGTGGAMVAAAPLWCIQHAGSLPMHTAFQALPPPSSSTHGALPKAGPRQRGVSQQPMAVPLLSIGQRGFLDDVSSPQASPKGVAPSPHMLSGSGVTQILGRGMPDDAAGGVVVSLLPAPRKQLRRTLSDPPRAAGPKAFADDLTLTATAAIR
jgi:hypothetical protein